MPFFNLPLLELSDRPHCLALRYLDTLFQRDEYHLADDILLKACDGAEVQLSLLALFLDKLLAPGIVILPVAQHSQQREAPVLDDCVIDILTRGRSQRDDGRKLLREHGAENTAFGGREVLIFGGIDDEPEAVATCIRQAQTSGAVAARYFQLGITYQAELHDARDWDFSSRMFFSQFLDVFMEGLDWISDYYRKERTVPSNRIFGVKLDDAFRMEFDEGSLHAARHPNLPDGGEFEIRDESDLDENYMSILAYESSKDKLSMMRTDEFDALPKDEPYPFSRFINRGESRAELFVGEGNFSFVRAYVAKRSRRQMLVGKMLLATEYQPKRDLMTKPNFRENMEYLHQQGIRVRFGVDAKDLSDLQSVAAFDRIHFNFPHDGSSFKARTLPAMLAAFFRQAAVLQQTHNQVRIALPKPANIGSRQFYQAYYYQIFEVAARAGYVLAKVKPFGPARYPGYIHNMTRGDASASVSDDAREYVFVKTGMNFDEILRSEFRPGGSKWAYGESNYYLRDVATDGDLSSEDDAPGDGDNSAAVASSHGRRPRV